jgi:hypothetical protein
MKDYSVRTAVEHRVCLLIAAQDDVKGVPSEEN